MPKRLNLTLNSECCLWYDGKRGRRGDSNFWNRPVTFESNRIGTSDSNSNRISKLRMSLHHKLCLLVHNASVGRASRAPAYITDLLQPAATTSSRSSLQATSRGDYVVPRTNRRLADRAFSTAAPRTWNQLLTYLKMTQLTSAFRRGLKTFLSNRAYSSE